MIDTNTIVQITQATNDTGIRLTENQITVIVAAGAAAARWLRSEIKLGVETWTKVGGWAGIKSFFNSGKPEPISQPNLDAATNGKSSDGATNVAPPPSP